MRLELTLLTATVLFIGFATADVWKPSPEIDRSFENDNWEIIVQDMEHGGGTLEAKVNQQGKRTMYLDRRSLGEMVSNCELLYDYSTTVNPSPCPEFRSSVYGQ